MQVHPLKDLSTAEVNEAGRIVSSKHPKQLLKFREISLREPPKAELVAFLELEHSGYLLASSPWPARVARVTYDAIGKEKRSESHVSLIDLNSKTRIAHEILDARLHAPIVLSEYDDVVAACAASPDLQEALSEFELPNGYEVVIEPWSYGNPSPEDGNKRYLQGLCFARDTRNGNPDTNFYGHPLPLIPVMDTHNKRIVRIERLATGGQQDGFRNNTHSSKIIDHCASSEYVPELLSSGSRKDLKPLAVVQPEGPSFSVTDESLVEWQKWRFRVSFNGHEGAVLHDIHYAGRSILYRLSMSELTVPYADPRPPFARKQPFDFGDEGGGNSANNLKLGCDCLGAIKYFSSVSTNMNGTGQLNPNVVCLHEQDNGIYLKSANSYLSMEAYKLAHWPRSRRTQQRQVTQIPIAHPSSPSSSFSSASSAPSLNSAPSLSELVIQFIITLANYDYIFAYKFDLAGNITVEARATGIVSIVSIDKGKTSPYGTVVSPGALAQNHQHLFCIRIDPAVGGHGNSIVVEESHPLPIDPATNPSGNAYRIQQTALTRPCALDAAPSLNRTIKILNKKKRNPISGRVEGYKFLPAATQLMLADEGSVQARRAGFAKHHVWVTKYRDYELYAGGEYTLLSRDEVGGVSDAVRRDEELEGHDVVVWNTFGFTHNPRVEDWPVMPMEIAQLHLRPADFFEGNPALDAPSEANLSAVRVEGKERNGQGEVRAKL